MGLLFIAFILGCGYTFTSHYPPASYRHNRSTGWNLYFYVAVYGFAFLLLGGFTVILLDISNIPSWILKKFGMDLAQVSQKFSRYTDHEITIYEFTAGLTALAYSFALSRFLTRRMQNSPWLSEILKDIYSDDELEEIFFESLLEGAMVSLTLESRKCYIGIVFSLNPDDGPLDSLSIIPMVSGYRDEKTLELKLVRSYYEHYEKAGLLKEEEDLLGLEGYRLVIPIRQILHASFFDLDVYDQLASSD